ncbi:MAG TPA: ABC transporter permease [Candidatus Caenarcaniphilales bacterium]
MSLIQDSWHLFNRTNTRLVRKPFLIFFSLFQPIIFLLLFTQLFSRFAAVPGFPADNYLLFAVPGIILQNSFTSAFQSGTAMVEDLKSGFLAKMLVTQVNRQSILLGRIAADSARVAVQTLIIFTIGYAMGAHPATGVAGLLLMLLISALFGLAWGGLSIFIGLKTKSSESVFAIAGFLTFPLLFMSTALTPANFMPDWMQNVTRFNPISYGVDAIRVLMLSGFEWQTIWPAFAVIGSLIAITMGLVVYEFRKVVG